MAKFSVSGLKTKVKDGFVDLKTYWNHPKEGNYISNKELFLLCIGGSGGTGVGNVLGYISFAASSFLVGAVYGISFRDIFVKDLLGLFFFFFSILTMTIIDNLGRPPKKTMRLIHIVCAACVALGIGCLFIPAARTEKILPAFPQIMATYFLFNVFSVYYHVFLFRTLAHKFGKFRTWVLVGSIPTIITILLMGFLPIKNLDYATKLWVVNLLFSFFGLFSNFHGQKGNIMNLMTPNTQERTKIRTWEMFVSGAVGGLFMVLLPIFADLVGGLNNIKTYQFIIPAGVLICTPMVLVQVFGLKERVIVEVQNVPFRSKADHGVHGGHDQTKHPIQRVEENTEDTGAALQPFAGDVLLIVPDIGRHQIARHRAEDIKEVDGAETQEQDNNTVGIHADDLHAERQ